VTDRYVTIAGDSAAEIEVKRSRFLCSLHRASEESGARAFVEEMRRRHWEARHHCSAFVLGPDGSTARSSDDGEPAGTAGAPMLEVLRGAGVSDVVAVVSRYFGGILLGAGGLVRAYGDAVRAGLDSVRLMERQKMRLYVVEVDHAHAGRVENDLRARGITVRGARYGDRVGLDLAVAPGVDLDALIAEVSAGELVATACGEDWVDGG
jgi:uncharacterized YigZ family protein